MGTNQSIKLFFHLLLKQSWYLRYKFQTLHTFLVNCWLYLHLNAIRLDFNVVYFSESFAMIPTYQSSWFASSFTKKKKKEKTCYTMNRAPNNKNKICDTRERVFIFTASLVYTLAIKLLFIFASCPLISSISLCYGFIILLWLYFPKKTKVK
jgi:hypothetical protein